MELVGKGVTETPAMKVDKAAEVIEKNSTKRLLSKGVLKDKSRKKNFLGGLENIKLNDIKRNYQNE